MMVNCTVNCRRATVSVDHWDGYTDHAHIHINIHIHTESQVPTHPHAFPVPSSRFAALVSLSDLTWPSRQVSSHRKASAGRGTRASRHLDIVDVVGPVPKVFEGEDAETVQPHHLQ